MSEYLSNRQRKLNIGISSYTENQLVLDVTGNTNITGVTTLASAGGITTTGGDLYVGGTVFLRDISLSPGSIETNYLNVSIASTLGIASASSLYVSGISTIGEVTITPSGIITSTNPGVSTVVYYGDGSNLFGVSAFSVVNQGLTSDIVYPTLANNAGVTTVGISTNEFVFIPSTGSLGIGTTNPISKLNVIGDVNFSGITTIGEITLNSNGIITSTNPGVSTVVYYGDGSNLFGVSAFNVITQDTSGSPVYPTFASNTGVSSVGISSEKFVFIPSSGKVGIGTINPISALSVVGDGYFSGIVTASTFVGNLTGTATTATKLENIRTFQITGDIVASSQNFDGTQNVSLASSISPNSVGLGTYTYGDYVKNITGTVGEIEVSVTSGEGVSPQIGLPDNVTITNNLTVTNDLQVNHDLNVNGNITIGGTSAYIIVNDFRVKDRDIVLGFTTDAYGNDVSTDTTANHGGISVASTEGSPLVQLYNPGVGETTPATYKKIMWFKSGAFVGLNTDAWLFNYGVGIGSTQIPNGVRLAVGGVQITEFDISKIRNINASGIITANTFRPSSGYIQAADGTNSFYIYGGTGNVAFQGTIGASQINNASGYKVIGFAGTDITFENNAYISGVTTSIGGFVGNLTGTATTATNLSDAANITTGTINSSRLSGTYNIDISGSSSYATSSGISTYATSSGIATYATSSGIATVSQGLTGTPNIVVGIITASSFVGSGTSLTDVRIGISSNNTIIGFAGTINFAGSGISTITVSSGIATVNIPATVRTTSYTVATEGQTIFPCSYTIGYVEVYFNGVKLSPTQYSATDGANIILYEGASANDIVETTGYNGVLKLSAGKTILTEVSSDGLTFYTGKAAVGIATTEASWTIRRSLFSSAGIVTSTGIARNIAWSNRVSGIYT